MNLRKHQWFLICLFGMFLILAISSYILLDNIIIPAWSNNPNKSKMIKVLVRTGAESEAIRKIAEPFEEQTGIKVNFIELSRDDYFTDMATQLFAGSNAFDVIMLPSTSIAQFASAKAIVPLDGFMKETGAAGFHTDMDDFLVTSKFNGVVYALPTDISTHFMYYRSDLIPKPPDTWDELLEDAKKYSKRWNNHSSTQWGLAMPAVMPEERPKIFDTILWSFGGGVVSEDGSQIYFDTKESIRAGKYLDQLMKEKVIPDDILSWDFPRTRDALLNGEIAMAVPFWNAATPMIRQSLSKYRDVIKIALVPGIKQADGTISRTVFQHSWTLAINANSSRKDEAWKFIAFCTGKQGGRIYAQSGGTPARRSILADPAMKRIRPDFPLILESFKISKSEPTIPYYQAMFELEGNAVAKILTSYSKPQEALKEAANELRRLSIHDYFHNLNH
jgi:multiple sugar transport system substrate-binding protein